MTTTKFYLETKDGQHEVPITIEGRYVPRVPQNWHEPGNCAHFEDVEIYVDLEDGSTGARRVDVPESVLAPFSAEELLFEQERDNQCGHDPSDHYKAMRDEGHRI